MKKGIRILLVVVLFLLLLLVSWTGRNKIVDETKEDAQKNAVASCDLRVGVILIGDETQGDSREHIEGMNLAAAKLGIPEENIVWKERIEDADACFDAAVELAEDECSLIVACNADLQDGMLAAAKEYPDVDFVTIGGNPGEEAETDNYYNASVKRYEARYLAGIVAGLKLEEMDADKKIPDDAYDLYGNVQVGYVATYATEDVITEYKAFFLGMKSVFDKVAMGVQYTNSRFDIDEEATAADAFIKSGCILIAQQAGSTGAADTAEKSWESGRYVYFVGCDQDTREEAPNATLTCVVNNWSVYYKTLLKAKLAGKEIPQDWTAGLDKKVVGLSKYGPHVAKQTKNAVDEAKEAIVDGSLEILDTASDLDHYIAGITELNSGEQDPEAE